MKMRKGPCCSGGPGAFFPTLAGFALPDRLTGPLHRECSIVPASARPGARGDAASAARSPAGVEPSPWEEGSGARLVRAEASRPRRASPGPSVTCRPPLRPPRRRVAAGARSSRRGGPTTARSGTRRFDLSRRANRFWIGQGGQLFYERARLSYCSLKKLPSAPTPARQARCGKARSFLGCDPDSRRAAVEIDRRGLGVPQSSSTERV
jgi:hypothetical protein